MAIAELTALGWTLADLLEKFGPMPATRIRVQPTPGTATEADALHVIEHEGRLCELVDGVLVEKTMGLLESMIAMELVFRLSGFAKQHRLGVVAGEAGTVRLAPGLIRIPDVSFFSWARLRGRDLRKEKRIPDLVPNLAVEVFSASNTPAEMKRKLAEYFATGVELVWFLDPVPRTVTVYRTPEESVLIQADGLLDGGQVLPGFSVRVGDLFDVAVPPEKPA